MLKIFIEHSTTKFTNFTRIKIIWILHLVIPALILTVQSIIFADSFFYLIFAFINNLMLVPLYYSISFISWIVSTNFTENIQIVKEYLNQNSTFMKYNHLNEANNFVTIDYKKINKIDNYLSSVFIISAIGVVCSIMLSVYFAFFADKFDFRDELIAFDLISQIIQLIQLLINCFINGKVYNESSKLLNYLDNLNINVNDDKLFKTLIEFKTSVQKTKCGFTIGGFAPWNSLTLLKV